VVSVSGRASPARNAGAERASIEVDIPLLA
jgi:hypothetical protein